MPLGENLHITDYLHGAQCTGFHEDLLAAVGGEASVKPSVTQRFAYRGRRFRWNKYTSKDDFIPLDEILSPNELVVGYGFCRIRAATAGKYILSIGSNDGVKVWLNGRNVHTHHPETGRWLARDDDYIPIDLRKGLNDLLVKVDEGSGDFGFVVRLLDHDKTVAEVRKNVESHTRLAVVTEDGAACVWFGQPYAISVLNPSAQVEVKMLDHRQRRLAVRSARPGFQIKFPLTDVPDGPLTFRARFPLSDRETITADRGHFKGKLPRHPNVRNVRGLAMLDDDGRPFLPIGMYSVPREAYPQVKAAGMNFVIGSASDLDAAHAAGLKVGVGLHTTGDHWREHIAKTVTAARSHPAVLFWMMFDEPGYNKADLLHIHGTYNLLWELDKVHPGYLVITTPSVYETFGRCCDVLAVDTYPVSRGDYASVPRAVARAYAVSDGDQPVWQCGQLFAWPRDRAPTPHEHRYMTYATLIEGAKAFLWYAYRHAGWSLVKDDPPLWEAHRRLVAELNDLASVIVAPGRGDRVEPNDGDGMIRAVIKSDGTRRFLFAANDAQTGSKSVSFPLPLQDDGMIEVYGENRRVRIEKGTLIDTFAPLDVIVYRLK
jgi:hypothetical protein